MHKPEELIKSAMGQVEKPGKSIILMHDFHRNTAEALHMVPKGEVTTVLKYDEMVRQHDKLSPDNNRPESSVARTMVRRIRLKQLTNAN
jgi:hypothetical protein